MVFDLVPEFKDRWIHFSKWHFCRACAFDSRAFFFFLF